ncbi:MAG: methyltransferase [Acetobacteraceae bacterium]
MAFVPESIAWYDRNAAAAAADYETLDPASVHAWIDDLLPAAPALILDVGAGIGRDAAWLARLGHDVVAVEPSAAMRAEGERLHPGVGLRWLADRLPALSLTQRLGLTFDLILLSGVWQHVTPDERPRAMRKLISLLKPGGVLTLTLRHGPVEAERAMHAVSAEEVLHLARDHGAMVVRLVDSPDIAGRSGISWTGVALRLPDDGTGALPLLRHLILNDQKSATYKLGLLRALCRIADGQAGLAEDRPDGTVLLPLGMVALNWLRLYLPLIAAELPQTPRNAGADGLGFAGEGFRALLAGLVPRLDLRVGARFSGSVARAVRTALQEAADLIAKMPATFMTYPNGGPVLPATRRLASRSANDIALDAPFLTGFGTLVVPRDLWRALGRFAVWVEPALIAEWMRLMRGYAARQGRMLDEGVMGTAMTWSEPTRETTFPRDRAIELLRTGEPLICVWSGRRLDKRTLDIDHCLPWVAWPCGDLWNLMPAHRHVNQHQKRDRLPADEVLRRAAEPIQTWWRRAYLRTEDPLLPQRFSDEARASLPGLENDSTASPLEVFEAMRVQRLRLRHDQQIPEWVGATMARSAPLGAKFDRVPD